MNKNMAVRMLVTIAAGFVLAAIVYASHPNWFNNHSAFVLPVLGQTPTPAPTTVAQPHRPTPTPATPFVGMVQHLDGIWINPIRVDRSQGTRDIQPNLGDEFLVVYLRVHNRSQVDYQVRQSDFQLLDSRGELDAPLPRDFTRMGLREVRLIPLCYTIGTLIFEAPARDPAATLIYQPDALDPTKRKEWLLR